VGDCDVYCMVLGCTVFSLAIYCVVWDIQIVTGLYLLWYSKGECVARLSIMLF
jgi:hypothetical protein